MANQQTVINADIHINGALTAKNLTAPAGAIDDTAIKAGAGIQASKLQHQYEQPYAQNGGAVSAADRRVIHVVRGATGLVVSFHVGVTTVCTGDAVITVDLKKNGTTILTATVAINSGDAGYALKAATVSATALVQGDVLEVVVTVSPGTGTLGNGVFALLNIREDAQ